MEMEKVKNILSSIFFGCFGFCLSLIIAPLAAIAIICYMTKISFEVGYDNSVVTDPKIKKELEEVINSVDYES